MQGLDGTFWRPPGHRLCFSDENTEARMWLISRERKGSELLGGFRLLACWTFSLRFSGRYWEGNFGENSYLPSFLLEEWGEERGKSTVNWGLILPNGYPVLKTTPENPAPAPPHSHHGIEWYRVTPHHHHHPMTLRWCYMSPGISSPRLCFPQLGPRWWFIHWPLSPMKSVDVVLVF